ADGDDDAWRFLAGGRVEDFFVADEFDEGFELFVSHGGGLGGAGEIFSDAAEIFFGDGADFTGGFFLAEAHGQVAEGDAAVAGVEPIRERATRASEAGDGRQRQGLDEGYDGAGDDVEEA